MSWDEWAAGVLNGIGAPIDGVNVDTLWAWSNAESGGNVMRWNNPLNTTLPWPGSIDQNSVGVKYYLTVQDGISATIDTLANGYYPVILDHLRRSVPRQDWSDACPNLGIWGTGCGWIRVTYGGYTGNLGVQDMTDDEHFALIDIQNKLENFAMPQINDIQNRVKATEDAVMALQATAGGLTPTQAQQLQDMHDALGRLENAFKSA